MRLTIRRPDDMHVHLRGGDVLRKVAKHTAAHFARALVMPNVPPIEDADAAAILRREIVVAAGGGFTPLMTMKLTASTTPETARAAKAAGVVAFKVYPADVTTGSHGGVTVDQIRWLGDAFEAMGDEGVVLCWHGEMPGAAWLEAESQMLPVIAAVVADHPKLKHVLEHISTADAATWVRSMPDRVAATITVHHLYLTLDDLGGRGAWGRGGVLRPHYFYSPIAKTVTDRAWLTVAAVSGDPKFFLGTDSAPHPTSDKFNVAGGCCAAGVFSAPVAMAALAMRFAQYDALDKLEDFCSRFGAEFYGLPLNEGSLTLSRGRWDVPWDIDGFTPFLAGEALSWRVA